MLPSDLIGVALGLAAGLVWGAGDFSGGLAARRSHPLRVVATAALSGAVLLGALAWLRGEAWSLDVRAAWAAGAGLAGAAGIGMLYHGLATASAAVVAPTAAVVGALVPVIYGLLAGVPPTGLQLTGFAVALLGIWLLTRSPGHAPGALRRGLVTGALAGVSFGGFFVLLAQVGPGPVFVPLVVARLVMLAAAVAVMAGRRRREPPLARIPVAWLAGLLDGSGNMLYLLATHFTRVDVAAVLSSLYPASTVLLAVVVLGERMNRGQVAGLAACLTAVALIAA